jgi:hypothetical protein
VPQAPGARLPFALVRSVVVSLLVLLVAAPTAVAGYRERDVRQAVRAAGFEDLAERAAAAALPTVLVGRKLLRRTPRALGTSRFGGNPDLPRGERWPQCGGRAQTFLGQIRLRGLPRAAHVLRRHGGLLLAFTAVEFEDPSETEYGLWAGRCTTLLHAPAGSSLVRVKRPRGAPTMPLRAARMRFSSRPDVPDLSLDEGNLGAPLLDVALGWERIDAWWDLRDGLRAPLGDVEHRILGYLDTPNGESGRCWSRSRRSTGAWRHLFTMGMDFGVGFDVADAGRLQVAVPPADLRGGRFDRACGIFDSA